MIKRFHFNNLTPAEAERLAFLAEEMGEALHAIGKVLRHGYESSDPTDGEVTSNRTMLETELGDVRAAMIMLCNAEDLSKEAVRERAASKLVSVKEWMHHQ